jgi:integrating conjugative element protein (TIGR03758 family)
MNADMNQGFVIGSGVDPALMRLTVLAIVSGVVFVIFAWLVLQITVAYRREEISLPQAMQSAIKAAVVLTILLSLAFEF